MPHEEAAVERTEWDLVIAGAGFSGLVAALVTAGSGLKTLVLESEAGPGGAAAISAGIIWAPETADALAAYVPDGDVALQRAYCANFKSAVAVLKAHTLPLTEMAALGTLGFGVVMQPGRSGDRHVFMGLMADAARELGARLCYRAPLTGADRTRGAYAVRIGGAEPRTVLAKSLLFATGGFQGSADKLERHLGAGAGRALFLRSVATSRGDGLDVALSLGAGTSRNMQRFYGHTMPCADVPLDALQPLTAYIAKQSVVLNRNGVRFVDESEGRFEEVILQDGWSQPGGCYFLLFDAKTYRDYGVDTGISSALPKLDRLEGWRQLGTSIVQSNSIEALVDRLSEREGVDAAQAFQTLSDFNRACHERSTATLRPPRTDDARPLLEPPFYAVKARGGITATSGGIRTDADCRVLRADGHALPRCYACGVDAGGVFGRTYGGFLGWALASGYIAGQTAIRDLRSQP